MDDLVPIDMYDIPIGKCFEYKGNYYKMVPNPYETNCGDCEFTKFYRGCSKVCCSRYARRDRKNVIVVKYIMPK